MKYQDKVAAFLQTHAGFYFCSFCVSRELDLDSFTARNAVWELQESPGYQMRTAKCVSCMRSKRVITAVGGFALLEPEAHVVAFLLDHKGLAFCDACLAFANEISVEDAQRVAGYLQSLPQFERRARTECSVCAAAKPVIAAVVAAGDGHHARRGNGNGLASLAPSRVQYRGWRIDVLSYRVAAGWRPFVVIHGPEQAIVPDTATLWAPVPTKKEADEYAVARAQEWIDKRF